MTVERTVSLTFDDCFEGTVKNVLPLLDEFGVRATFYACPNLVGGTLSDMKLADWSLLEEAVDRGHRIGSHTMSHASLPTTLWAQLRRFAALLSTEGVDASVLKRSVRAGLEYVYHRITDGSNGRSFDAAVELAESRRVLEERLDIDVRSFAYPGGVVSTRATALVADSAYDAARGTVPGINAAGTDLYRLHSFPWGTFTNIEEMNGLVTGGSPGWVIHTFHVVTNRDRPKYEYTTSMSELETHLRYLVDATDAEILPLEEVVARRTGRWPEPTRGRRR